MQAQLAIELDAGLCILRCAFVHEVENLGQLFRNERRFLAGQAFNGRRTAIGLVNQANFLPVPRGPATCRSEEHTSELQSLMRLSYAVFCLKKKKHTKY